jgi:hypothetical protein
MIKKLLLILVLLTSFFSNSQNSQTQKETLAEKAIDTIAKADSGFSCDLQLVNRYYWRGIDIDDSPAFQPDFSYAWKNGLKIGLWGTFGFSPMKETVDGVEENYGHYAEFDPYISYTKNWFSIELNDYFTVSTIGESDYMNFKKGETGHSGVVNVTLGGTEKFPLSFTASTVIYGADMTKDEFGEWGMGTRNNYSTYLELIYPFELKSIGLEINPELGMTPWGGYGYAEKSAFVNAGVRLNKSIRFSDSYSLPLELGILNNPDAEKTYFIMKVSFFTK